MLKMLRPPGPPPGPAGPPMPPDIALAASSKGMSINSVGRCGSNSASMPLSFTYWIGTWSTDDSPISLCSCSSLASNASGVPSWMVSCLLASCPGVSGRRCTRQYALFTIWILSTYPFIRYSLIISWIVISSCGSSPSSQLYNMSATTPRPMYIWGGVGPLALAPAPLAPFFEDFGSLPDSLLLDSPGPFLSPPLLSAVLASTFLPSFAASPCR
mmetsp:Transcript_125654/g.351912  ORF Transcript_125654/g.351912 Transcript_125654/m.351912 type:complete len:214 (+) Transcript_125654:1632-2273(+)